MGRASWWLMPRGMELALALQNDQLIPYIAEHPEG
jgi:hypothetical protein